MFDLIIEGELFVYDFDSVLCTQMIFTVLNVMGQNTENFPVKDT